MEITRARSWKGFVKAIDTVRTRYGVRRAETVDGKFYESNNRILFRGQSDESWELLTTLERKTKDQFDVYKYMFIASRGASEIESFTGADWKIPEFQNLEKEIKNEQTLFDVYLPSYDYLVYLRHHGFPSPLLDWTESPYIAAYFAYINSKNRNPAIYCYIERPNAIKGGTGGGPQITVKGPFVRTHKRHFAQKAWYTISTKWNHSDCKHYFCPHEDVFSSHVSRVMDQDVLVKIVLPSKLRKEALTKLNDYNINHFTLFQSEDSLIRSIELKEFDLLNK